MSMKELASRVDAVLAEVMAFDAGQLEELVQAAHTCTPKQMNDPRERFCVSRQALRMFWYFRCNLAEVQIKATND